MSDGGENPKAFGSHGVSERRLDPLVDGPEPLDERSWLDHARHAKHTAEALAALDHVLQINPDNQEARNLRLELQLGTLRDTVEPTVTNYREPFLERWGRPLTVMLGILLVVVLVVLLLGPVRSWLNDRQTATQFVEPTFAPVVLPATWTPEPTRTPPPAINLVAGPTEEGIQGRMEGRVPAYSGPASQQIVGFFEGTVVIKLLARSPDSAFLQVKPANYENRVWVQASLVQVLNGQIATLPVSTQVAPPVQRSPTP